jgi:tRNA dimethylallyltransferase
MRDALFLVGPTASGKTSVAIEIARTLPAEIISLDSMNVYRGMDIGTAKPAAEERSAVPHHLIDVVDPNESFSVGRYVLEAQRVAADIIGRGKKPLFVGGTPLYLKALTRGLFSGPSADWELREKLHERAEKDGNSLLHEELRQVDPEAAMRIHVNDLKRIVRALEVYRKTGKPISSQQMKWTQPMSNTGVTIAGLARDRECLYRRIEERVDAMFASGLVEEVQGLLKKYGTLSREASQALGYKEIFAYLDGKTELAQTIDLVKRNTRRMAKRQLTWFRSFGNIRWFPMNRGVNAQAVASEIVRYFRAEAADTADSRLGQE